MVKEKKEDLRKSTHSVYCADSLMKEIGRYAKKIRVTPNQLTVNLIEIGLSELKVFDSLGVTDAVGLSRDTLALFKQKIGIGCYEESTKGKGV
jgi:hypothetical protein